MDPPIITPFQAFSFAHTVNLNAIQTIYESIEELGA